MDSLSLQRLILDGLLLWAVMGVIILGSLYANPRLWLRDYPKSIQAKVPPNTPGERRVQWVLMLLFLGWMVGLLYYSATQVKAANGGTISFLTAWAHTFLLFNIGNLFDALVIDWLILTVMKPKFMILPGTDMAEYAVYHDVRLHLTNYLRGGHKSLLTFMPPFQPVNGEGAQRSGGWLRLPRIRGRLGGGSESTRRPEL
jgi:hypothetical protein